MNEIKMLLLDTNGVLVHYDRPARIEYLASVSGRLPEHIEAAIWESGFEDAGDDGNFDEPGYLQCFGFCMGFDLTEEQWLAAQRAAVSPIVATLQLLRRVHLPCGLLSNNNLLVRRHFATLYPEAAALVGNRAHVSAEYGVRKPAAEVYQRCVAELGVTPEVVLFIDDSLANVEGARRAGLHAHHYTGPEALAAELSRWGLLT